MRRYKRYLESDEVDIPRSTKHYRGRDAPEPDQLQEDIPAHSTSDSEDQNGGDDLDGIDSESSFSDIDGNQRDDHPDPDAIDHMNQIPMNHESDPGDDESHPDEDGSDPGDDESHPDEDGSDPGDDVSHPDEDGSDPGDDVESHPDDDQSEDEPDPEDEYDEGDFPVHPELDDAAGALYPGALITQAQSEALILAFSVRHHLSDVALRDLLTLINAHTPMTVHHSKYLFLKNLNQENAIHNFYCESCHGSLAFNNNGETDCCDNEVCSLKDVIQAKAHLKKSACFFLTMPLAGQLESLLSNPAVSAKLSQRNNASGVTSGEAYKGFVASGAIAPSDITLQWNTDGASASKSSPCSIWPIQVSINELPYKDRKQHIILTGLWQGAKPNMDTFLKPFVEELRELHTNGLTLQNGTRIKVHCLLSPVDSVARPALQNIHQFNGRNGCSYCLTPGERVDRLSGSARVYCGDVGEPRTEEQHLRDATEAVETGTVVNGVKGPSVLMMLPLFNIISSFTPDYMHNVLLGVVKWFLCGWLDPVNNSKPWYLSARQARSLSERINHIKPPAEVTRPPRSLTLRKYWKASEYRSFLLYYSVPCLKDILPVKYLKHWLLLVFTITTFLQENIADAEYELAKIAITQFVLETEVLYGKEWLTYNVHTLLHLPESVKMWGAPWDSSAFTYEHFNGVLLNLFSGTQHMSLQIFKNYSRIRTMNFIVNTVPRHHWNLEALTLLRNMSGKFLCVNSQRVDVHGLVILGACRPKSLTVHEQIAIGVLLNCDLQQQNVTCYQRFFINGIQLNVSGYQRLVKRRNSTVRLVDNTIFEIHSLVDLGANRPDINRYIVIGERQSVLNLNICSYGQFKSSKFVKVIDTENSNVCAILPSSVKSKCVHMTVSGEQYTCNLANSFERD